jgi:hypothetical protein
MSFKLVQQRSGHRLDFLGEVFFADCGTLRRSLLELCQASSSDEEKSAHAQ